MIMTTPYTYLIGWTSQNKWYYGARWANGCDPLELWVKYFTSSRHVAAMRKEWGEPDVVKVRQQFDNGRDARLWEERFIRRVKAVRSPLWLNRGNAGVEFAGPSPEAIAKNIARMTGVPRSAATKAKLSAAKKGIPSGKVMGDAEKEILRIAKLGVPRSDATKAKLRAANLGKSISPVAIAKSVAKNTGSKRSDATKEKMRLAWESRKANAPLTSDADKAAKSARLQSWHKTATPEAQAAAKARSKETWAAKKINS